VPNCKSFLVTEAERKHVRRRARFQQHGYVSCHQGKARVSHVQERKLKVPAALSNTQRNKMTMLSGPLPLPNGASKACGINTQPTDKEGRCQYTK